MKKLFTLAFVFTFVLSFTALAQPTVTIGDETGTSPVNVPVTIDLNGQDIGSFDFEISYDETIVGGVDFVEGATVFTEDPIISGFGGGTFQIGWGAGVTQIISDEVNFYLSFTGLAVGSSDLEFTSLNVDGENAIYDSAGGIGLITATFEPGAVTFDALPIPVRSWAIYIGLGLIIGFVVLRVTRVF